MNRRSDQSMNGGLPHVWEYQYGSWRFFSCLGRAETIQLFESVIQGDVVYDRVFRDNSRTLSAKISSPHGELMLKIPRARNRRIWERMLTFFRGSDAARTLHQLQLMKNIGLEAPQPVMACEKRFRGVVTDAFLCYRFVEGRTADSDDAGQVLKALEVLHGSGFLRSDAQKANFLMREQQVVFIDFRLKKPRFFVQLQKARELDRFLRSCPGSERHLSEKSRSNVWFRLAHLLENWSFRVREAKRFVRKRIK